MSCLNTEHRSVGHFSGMQTSGGPHNQVCTTLEKNSKTRAEKLGENSKTRAEELGKNSKTRAEKLGKNSKTRAEKLGKN